jgi:hypothetical protein
MTRALTSRVRSIIVIIFRKRLRPEAVHPTRIMHRDKTLSGIRWHEQRPTIEALFDSLRHPAIVRNHLELFSGRERVLSPALDCRGYIPELYPGVRLALAFEHSLNRFKIVSMGKKHVARLRYLC